MIPEREAGSANAARTKLFPGKGCRASSHAGPRERSVDTVATATLRTSE